MDGSELKEKIGQKRPRYKEKYRSLIESISIKGDSRGKGDYFTFGPIYHTFMYAFFVGYKLKKCNYIQAKDQTTDFIASFDLIKPASIRDFIIMLLLNETENYSIPYSWLELENANEEMIDNFIAELFRQMEGYVNAGFEYLQNKWDNEKIEFQDPFVFVNFLEELSR